MTNLGQRSISPLSLPFLGGRFLYWIEGEKDRMGVITLSESIWRSQWKSCCFVLYDCFLKCGRTPHYPAFFTLLGWIKYNLLIWIGLLSLLSQEQKFLTSDSDERFGTCIFRLHIKIDRNICYSLSNSYNQYVVFLKLQSHDLFPYILNSHLWIFIGIE